MVGTLARLQRIRVHRPRSAAGRPPRSTTRWPTGSRRRGRSCSSPKGRPGDGNRVLPFRSSLVGAARAALAEPAGERIQLQPLAIAYTRRNGLPVGRRERPAIAWYGDMDLVPHLAPFCAAGPLDVVVIWGEPIPFDGDRKEATARRREPPVRRGRCAEPARRG